MEVFLGIANLFVVSLGVFLVIKQLRLSREQQIFDLFLSSEKDFDQLNVLMLEEKNIELRNIYRMNDANLENVDDETLKKFIYFELYYAHLFRIFTLLKSKSSISHKNGFTKEYWSSYRKLIQYYAKDKCFILVHQSAIELEAFTKEFRNEIEEIIKST